jgi:Protein of unknown function (DUF1036)
MGASSVSFHNSYTTVIYVAYLRLDHGCGDDCGEPWDVLGWVRLPPGDTQSRANPTSNEYFYYYAEAADGASWAGPYVAEVTNERFEKCTCLGVIVENGGPTNPYYDVGFRELDTDQYGGVNFIP